MTLTQSILIGLIYYLGNNSFFMGWNTIYRPIVGGWLVGCVLGNPVQGAIIGANINLIYIGFLSAGGSLPGDPCLAGTLSTALALAYGYDVDTALAIAVPLGLLGTIIWVGCMTLNSLFIPVAEKLIDDGKDNLLWVPGAALPLILKLFIVWLPVTLACYYGADYVAQGINMLGGKVLHALNVVGGMLPAIGIAMNLQAIFKGDAKIFLLVGFILSTYFHLPTVGVTLVAIAFAVILNKFRAPKAPVVANDEEDF